MKPDGRILRSYARAPRRSPFFAGLARKCKSEEMVRSCKDCARSGHHPHYSWREVTEGIWLLCTQRKKNKKKQHKGVWTPWKRWYLCRGTVVMICRLYQLLNCPWWPALSKDKMTQKGTGRTQEPHGSALSISVCESARLCVSSSALPQGQLPVIQPWSPHPAFLWIQSLKLGAVVD